MPKAEVHLCPPGRRHRRSLMVEWWVRASPRCDQPRRGGNNSSGCEDHKCIVDPLRLAFGFLNVRSLVDNEGQRNVSWRSGERDQPRVDNKSALLCQELRKNKLEVVGVAETLWFDTEQRTLDEYYILTSGFPAPI